MEMRDCLLAYRDTPRNVNLRELSFAPGIEGIQNFFDHQGSKSMRLHGKARTFDDIVLRKGMKEADKGYSEFKPRDIFNVDEAGLFLRLLRRHTSSPRKNPEP